jgi:DNA (cytosine-5)-methyltransferase 1
LNAPTFGSLFSGYGGIDLGLEAAGFEVAWQVEADPFCRSILHRHWPDIPLYSDIRLVDWRRVRRVDLLAGGFPCQPVSQAGKKLAQEDERWLWPEFARAIRALRPRVVLVENVPGLRSRGFGDVLGDLAACGYDAEWDGISAAAVGAPHLRDRVWLVAWRASEGISDADRVELPIERSRAGQQQGESRAAEPRTDGEAGPVADAAGERLEDGLGGARGRATLESEGSGPSADAIDGDDGGVHARRGEEGGADERREPQGPLGQRAPSTGAPSDTDGGGREGERIAEPGRVQRARWGLADGLGNERLFDITPGRSDHWDVEPDVGRVVDGATARLDIARNPERLHILGNGAVPQVVEHVGHLIRRRFFS